MEDRIFELLMKLIPVAALLLTGFLLPLLKQKIGEQKMDKILYWIRIAVWAAEQLFPDKGSGALRKKYVISFLADRGIKLKAAQLDALIEATVYEVNTAGGVR